MDWQLKKFPQVQADTRWAHKLFLSNLYVSMFYLFFSMPHFIPNCIWSNFSEMCGNFLAALLWPSGKLLSVSHHILRCSPVEATTKKQWLQYNNVRQARPVKHLLWIHKQTRLLSFDITLLYDRFTKLSLLIPGHVIVMIIVPDSTILWTAWFISYPLLLYHLQVSVEVWLLRNAILFTKGS